MTQMPEPFDLAYPLNAVGFSSAWRSGDDLTATMNWPALAARRVVALAAGPAAEYCPVSESDAAAQALTSRFGTHLPVKIGDTQANRADFGLSSGAGSALLRLSSGVVKIKRCGFADQGIEKECARVATTSVVGGRISDDSTIVTSGLMGLDSAAAEIALAQQLRELGLCQDYKPMGVYVLIDKERTHSAAAVVFEITSDLRVDEFLFMAISPVIVDLLEQGRLRFEARTSRFYAVRLEATTQLIDRCECGGTVELVGEMVGAAYSALYGAGFSRGRGSAWLGNEVVGAGGISLVDLDGGMAPIKALSKSHRDRLMQIEIAEYVASVWGYFSWGSPVIFSVLADAYVRGFNRGILNRLSRWDTNLVSDVLVSSRLSNSILANTLRSAASSAR